MKYKVKRSTKFIFIVIPTFCQCIHLIIYRLEKTCYDTRTIIPGRVPCYLNRKSGGFRNAVSRLLEDAFYTSVQDLFIWNKGLLEGKLIKKETLRKAWTSYCLNDGTEVDYGYGWQTGGELTGCPMIEHGGLAAGYSTDALYLPKENMFVAVFTDQRGILPEITAAKLTAIALGKPDTIKAIVLSDSLLQTYAGVYIQDSVQRYITLSNHQLYYQRADNRAKLWMRPYAIDKFFFENTSVLGKIKRDGAKKITDLFIFNNRHPSSPTIFKRTDLLLPASKTDR